MLLKIDNGARIGASMGPPPQIVQIVFAVRAPNLLNNIAPRKIFANFLEDLRPRVHPS